MRNPLQRAKRCCSYWRLNWENSEPLSVEGHTDANPYVSSTGYSNWELSADRANEARKLIQLSGVRPDQVADVRGFADQQLRKPQDPTSASNRRVSIVVKYMAAADPPSPVASGKPTPAGEAKPAAPAKPSPASPYRKKVTGPFLAWPFLTHLFLADFELSDKIELEPGNILAADLH